MGDTYWLAWGLLTTVNVGLFTGSLYLLRSTKRLIKKYATEPTR